MSQPRTRRSPRHWRGFAQLAAIVVAGCAALLLLVGCAKPPVSGVVEHKQHSDRVVYQSTYCAAYTTDRSSYRSGNQTYTTTTTRCILYGTHDNVIPASWELCIHGPDEDGKMTTGCIEVGEARWHRYAEGDRYDPAELR
jgi:hypothetical protein